jgi:hypothetical protein
MRTSFAVLAVLSIAAAARAQTPAVPLPRNDATVSVGWFGAQYPHQGEYGTGWHPSLFAGVGGGHYWTEHLKTEVEAAWLSRVHAYSYETLAVDGGTAYLTSEYRLQTVKFSLAQGYQFGENAWVHPYVAAGADIDSLREAEDRPSQTRPVYFSNAASSAAVSIPAVHEREATMHVRPFFKTGFKMYFSDRAFFATEWKLGFGNGLQHLLWKSGLGVDF